MPDTTNTTTETVATETVATETVATETVATAKVSILDTLAIGKVERLPFGSSKQVLAETKDSGAAAFGGGGANTMCEMPLNGKAKVMVKDLYSLAKRVEPTPGGKHPNGYTWADDFISGVVTLPSGQVYYISMKVSGETNKCILDTELPVILSSSDGVKGYYISALIQ